MERGNAIKPTQVMRVPIGKLFPMAISSNEDPNISKEAEAIITDKEIKNAIFLIPLLKGDLSYNAICFSLIGWLLL